MTAAVVNRVVNQVLIVRRPPAIVNRVVIQSLVGDTPVMSPFDTFDRGSYPASLGVSTSGDTWTSLLGGFTIAQGSGNSYAQGSSDRNVAVFNYGTPDVTLMCHIQSYSGDSNQGLTFRAVNSSNFYAVGDGSMFKMVGGTITNIGPPYANFNVPTFLKLVLNGSSIKLYENGMLVADITDTSLSGTKHGIYARFSAPHHILDFGIDELLSPSWSVGSIRM